MGALSGMAVWSASSRDRWHDRGGGDSHAHVCHGTISYSPGMYISGTRPAAWNIDDDVIAASAVESAGGHPVGSSWMHRFGHRHHPSSRSSYRCYRTGPRDLYPQRTMHHCSRRYIVRIVLAPDSTPKEGQDLPTMDGRATSDERVSPGCTSDEIFIFRCDKRQGWFRFGDDTRDRRAAKTQFPASLFSPPHIPERWRYLKEVPPPFVIRLDRCLSCRSLRSRSCRAVPQGTFHVSKDRAYPGRAWFVRGLAARNQVWRRGPVGGSADASQPRPPRPSSRPPCHIRSGRC